jgi:hypothetical protein
MKKLKAPEPVAVVSGQKDAPLVEALALASKSSLYAAEVCAQIEKRLGQVNEETMRAIREVVEANKPKPRTLQITVTSKDSRENTITRHYKINVE